MRFNIAALCFWLFVFFMVFSIANVKALNIEFGQANFTETDPFWSANFTNMQVDCSDGNYTYGVGSDGTLKCRSDVQGGAGAGDGSYNATYEEYLDFINAVNNSIDERALLHNATEWVKAQGYSIGGSYNATYEEYLLWSYNLTYENYLLWAFNSTYEGDLYNTFNQTYHDYLLWAYNTTYESTYNESYLTSYSETDPVFSLNLSDGVSNNWNPIADITQSLGSLLKRWLDLFAQTIWATNVNATNVNATFFYGNGTYLTSIPFNSYNTTYEEYLLWAFNQTYQDYLLWAYNITYEGCYNISYLTSYSETDPLWSSNFTGKNLSINNLTANKARVDKICVGKECGAGVVVDVYTNGTRGYRIETDSPLNYILGTYTTGDAFSRWRVFGSGLIQWGTGNVTTDTNLFRSGANELSTNSSFIIFGNASIKGNLTMQYPVLTIEHNKGGLALTAWGPRQKISFADNANPSGVLWTIADDPTNRQINITAATVGGKEYAEMIRIDDDADMGDVICINASGSNVKCTIEFDKAFISVVTNFSALVMNPQCLPDYNCSNYKPIAVGGTMLLVKTYCYDNDGIPLKYGARMGTSNMKAGVLEPSPGSKDLGDSLVGIARTICRPGLYYDNVTIWKR